MLEGQLEFVKVVDQVPENVLVSLAQCLQIHAQLFLRHRVEEKDLDPGVQLLSADKEVLLFKVSVLETFVAPAYHDLEFWGRDRATAVGTKRADVLS